MHKLHCLPPNPSDMSVIEDFLDSICCTVICTLCQQVGSDRVWVRVNNLYVLVPTDCEEYPNNFEEVELASSTLGLRPGVIFYGNPTDYHFDAINYTAYQQKLAVYWTGAKNCTRYSQWLRKQCDGVDLVKDFFGEGIHNLYMTQLE